MLLGGVVRVCCQEGVAKGCCQQGVVTGVLFGVLSGGKTLLLEGVIRGVVEGEDSESHQLA